MKNILKTEIEDVLLLRSSIHTDLRGYFFESYNKLLPVIFDILYNDTV